MTLHNVHWKTLHIFTIITWNLLRIFMFECNEIRASLLFYMKNHFIFMCATSQALPRTSEICFCDPWISLFFLVKFLAKSPNFLLIFLPNIHKNNRISFTLRLSGRSLYIIVQPGSARLKKDWLLVANNASRITFIAPSRGQRNLPDTSGY